jgi:hypothetical protein
MLVVIVALTLVAQPVLAKQPDNPLSGSKIEKAYTDAINKLERYLSISETGNIVLNAPKRVIKSIDSEVYQSLLAGLEQTNSMIDSGYLVANPDFTLTVTEKYSVEGIQPLSSSGGINAVYYYWWGMWIYLSDATCDAIVLAMGTGGGISAILSAVLGPAAPIAVIVAGVLWIGASVIAYVDRNNTGIKIRFHYILPFPTYIGAQ